MDILPDLVWLLQPELASKMPEIEKYKPILLSIYPF